MTHDDARGDYAHFGQREWSRLSNPADGALEFAVNRRVIARYLAAGARVLDIGGGPGRYTLWLAGLGHHLALADLSSELLAITREHVAEDQADQVPRLTHLNGWLPHAWQHTYGLQTGQRERVTRIGLATRLGDQRDPGSPKDGQHRIRWATVSTGPTAVGTTMCQADQTLLNLLSVRRAQFSERKSSARGRIRSATDS